MCASDRICRTFWVLGCSEAHVSDFLFLPSVCARFWVRFPTQFPTLGSVPDLVPDFGLQFPTWFPTLASVPDLVPDFGAQFWTIFKNILKKSCAARPTRLWHYFGCLGVFFQNLCKIRCIVTCWAKNLTKFGDHH